MSATSAETTGESGNELTLETDDEIADAVDALQEEYSIPTDEAERIVEQRYDVEVPDDSSSSGDENNDETLYLDSLESLGEGTWGEAEVEVIQVWDAGHPEMEFVGLVGDETGSAKLTIWSGAELPSEISEGDVLSVENAVIDEYNGTYSLKAPSTAIVTEGERSPTVGRIRDVAEGTGLIMRCSHDDCDRVLHDGECPEHDSVDGEPDLRIKASLSVTDSDVEQTVFFDAEQTSEILGISLDDAVGRARKAMDRGILEEDVREALIGRRVEVLGNRAYDSLFVEEYELGEQPDPVQVIEEALA